MKILVTGATGFVGFRLIQHLKAEGHTVFATGRNREMGEKIAYLEIPFRRGDVSDAELTQDLCKGMDAVVHVAGLSSPWGPYDEFYRCNVLGTRNVVKACLAQGVGRLVHMSTPSIYVDNRNRIDVSEDDPLPEHFINHYAATKFEAEKVVLEGAAAGLKTVMLRPRAICGEGDTVIMPRLLRAHREGRLRVIGDGKNLVDMTGVKNVLHAVSLGLAAEGEALGQAYNITGGEPVRLWDTVAEVLSRLDLKLNRSKIPFVMAYSIAGALEVAAMADPKQPEPSLLRYSVIMLARSQTLNIQKARRLLGFEPVQSTGEAMDEFVNWWKQTHWLK